MNDYSKPLNMYSSTTSPSNQQIISSSSATPQPIVVVKHEEYTVSPSTHAVSQDSSVHDVVDQQLDDAVNKVIYGKILNK